MRKHLGFLVLLVMLMAGCNDSDTYSAERPPQKAQENSTDQNIKPTAQANLDLSCLNNPKFSQVALQDYDINSPTSDQELKKINDTLEPSCIIIKSVRAEIPEMQSNPEATLGPWHTNGYFLFDVRLRPSYQTTGIFYQFDLNEGTFKKLTKISALTSGTPIASSYSSCLNKDVVAFVPNQPDGDNKELYFLDFKSDNYKKVVELGDNETFNSGTAAIPVDDVLCQTYETTFRYAVYEKDNFGKKRLKTYRDISI